MPADLQYLYFLQNIRIGLGGTFDEFFNAISKLAVGILCMLPYAVYWSSSKRWGYRFITTLWGGEIGNGILKLTVCAYRPWIRSDLIEPAGDSKVAATGYSFPSGHTMCATALYGTAAVWQAEKRRWISILCAVLILLTMFSRNFLGVHTPQDVIVGFLETALIIYLTGKLMDWMSGNEKRKDFFTVLGILFVFITLIYILNKPYPMDYVNGELLVDPVRMMKDCFGGCGGFLGLMIGGWAERHYVRYKIPAGHPDLPLLTAIGVGILVAWEEYFAPATVILLLGRNWGNFAAGFIMVFFAVAVYPCCIRSLARSKESTE